MQKEKNDYISEYRLRHKDHWKQCVAQLFLNCAHIHPLQQAKVQAIIEELSENEDVQRIVIFGFSVTYQCQIGSDVDLFVQMRADYNPLNKFYPFAIDLWNNFRVDNRLMSEINQKGVTVYERG